MTTILKTSGWVAVCSLARSLVHHIRCPCLHLLSVLRAYCLLPPFPPHQEDDPSKREEPLAPPPTSLRAVTGRLVVDLIAGDHIRDADTFGFGNSSDVYVVANVERALPADTKVPREGLGKWLSRTVPMPPSRDQTTTLEDAGSSPNFAKEGNGRMEVDLVGSVEGNTRQQLWLEVWDEDDAGNDEMLGQACIELKAAVLAVEQVPLGLAVVSCARCRQQLTCGGAINLLFVVVVVCLFVFWVVVLDCGSNDG